MSQSDEAVEVLRAVWSADGQTTDGQAADGQITSLDEVCGPAKQCKNMSDVTFDGLAEPGSDLRSAWRDRLAREGKLGEPGHSLRDLVLGTNESD